jgi:hypothetical protein
MSVIDPGIVVYLLTGGALAALVVAWAGVKARQWAVALPLMIVAAAALWAGLMTAGNAIQSGETVRSAFGALLAAAIWTPVAYLCWRKLRSTETT